MNALRAEYEHLRKTALEPLAVRLDAYLRQLFSSWKRIDRISVRAKDVDRFVAKASKRIGDTLKYDDPLRQIQDQIGARIVTFYKTDVTKVSKEVEKYFRAIETRRVVPDSVSEFGYEGVHFILFLPRDVYDDEIQEGQTTPFFELQIKTLFQHAWAEAGHDLGYKPDRELTSDHKRRIAFTAAQAWGADEMFEELSKSLSAH